jgi:uncharacterized RDD family membrane protein YckC
MTAPEQAQRIIVTPEGLTLPMEIAPLGSRAAAFAIDFLFMLIAAAIPLGLVLVGGGSSSSWLVLIVLSTFVIFNFYFPFFELLWRGTTPGKRAVGLRVVSRSGGPLTTGAVFARNLMRELELYLPLQMLLAPELFYGSSPYWAQLLASSWILIFLFMPFFNRDRARCGDLVAGTLVVTQPEVRLMPDLAASPSQTEDPYQFTDRQLEMYGIRELQVLEEILQQDVTAPERQDLLYTVCRKICHKIAWKDPVPFHQVLPFLHAFYRAQRRRLEQRLLLGERREHKRPGRLEP